MEQSTTQCGRDTLREGPSCRYSLEETMMGHDVGHGAAMSTPNYRNDPKTGGNGAGKAGVSVGTEQNPARGNFEHDGQRS